MLTARLAMGLVFVAKWVERFWPADRLPEIQTKTIDDRLAVATFSLGILVSALSSSATAAAPRATELLMGKDDTPDVRAIRNCFVLGATRGYDQDPRFGLIVLSEVAQRGLWPAVNDPGTAIGVLATLTRLVNEADRALAGHQAKAKAAKADKPDGAADEIKFDRVTLPELDIRTRVVDSFAPIAHDGASMLEVGIRLQKMLATIARNSRAPIALEARLQAGKVEAGKAMERGPTALSHPDDRRQLEALHERLFSA
jgi:uncharacterized membrane protein